MKFAFICIEDEHHNKKEVDMFGLTIEVSDQQLDTFLYHIYCLCLILDICNSVEES